MHQAHFALLADGPREGDRIEIRPGQMDLAISERFEVDQGHTDVTIHYAYQGPTGSDPDTVIFAFRQQEQHVTVDH
jgi:hypothetical protein